MILLTPELRGRLQRIMGRKVSPAWVVGGDWVRPQPAGDVRVRQLFAPVERFHAFPKPGARKGEVTLIRRTHQRRY